MDTGFHLPDGFCKRIRLVVGAGQQMVGQTLRGLAPDTRQRRQSVNQGADGLAIGVSSRFFDFRHPCHSPLNIVEAINPDGNSFPRLYRTQVQALKSDSVIVLAITFLPFLPVHPTVLGY